MGWLLVVGLVLIFVGFIVAAASAEVYDGEIGVVIGVCMFFGGIIIAIIGGIDLGAESSAADTAGQAAVTAAAESQGLTITDPQRSSATVIGDQCTLQADLVDDKLVLRGSDPDIVLSADYVDLVCQGAAR